MARAIATAVSIIVNPPIGLRGVGRRGRPWRRGARYGWRSAPSCLRRGPGSGIRQGRRSAVASSRLPVGSSASTNGGRLASARATATRCCSPPDSFDGRWSGVGEAERTEQGFGAFARGGGLGAVDQLRQDDILARVEVGQQMVELIDEAQCVAAHPGAAIIVERRGLDCPRCGSTRRSRLRAGRPPGAGSICPSPTGRAERRSRPGDVEVDPAQHVDGDVGLSEAAREVRGLRGPRHS